MLTKRKTEPANEQDELHKEYGILQNSVYILKNIVKYRKSLLWFMILGAICGSMMEYLWTFISKFVIDLVQQQAAEGTVDHMPLVKLLAVICVIEIISMGLNSIANSRVWYNMTYVRMKMIQERIAKSLFMEFETLEDPKMLDRANKAERATGSDHQGVQGMMQSIYNLMTQGLLIAVTFSTLMTLNLFLVAVIAVLSFIQFLFFRYTVKKDRRETWEKLTPTWRKIHYMERVTQDFSYAKDIRLFGMKKWLSGKQHGILEEKYIRMRNSRNYWMYNSLFSHSISLIRDGITYGFLIYCVLFNDLSIGDFTLYLGIAATFSGTLTNLMNGIGQFKERSMQVDDFRSYLEIETASQKDTVPVPRDHPYTIEFRNVSFRYRGQEKYAVENLSLTLNAGERLAVVGLNGAGKTTFIKLLLRLYDVSEGEILLNGIDIRRFDRREYYSLFAPVFQNVEIFAFPMSENVSMKSPDETDTDNAEQCLRMAGMSDKIDELPNGVQTELLKVIYEDGIDLSGGQKQKLALARALYKDTPFMVLDEPTAALDALAEYRMYTDFDRMTQGKTAVYISHRLSSTRFCDHIAMFADGKMVEYGTHTQLLKRGGAYAEMFEVQAQYYKEDAKEGFGDA